MAAELFPVVVGGAIGLAGGFVGPFFLQRYRDQADKRKLRAQKFEQLIAALYEHKHWLDVSKNNRVFKSEAPSTESPLGRVFAISVIYFPELKDDLANFDLNASAYELWAINAGIKRTADPQSNFKDGFADAYGPYLTAFQELIGRLRELAKDVT